MRETYILIQFNLEVFKVLIETKMIQPVTEEKQTVLKSQ
jgi:hypothetical protein